MNTTAKGYASTATLTETTLILEHRKARILGNVPPRVEIPLADITEVRYKKATPLINGHLEAITTTPGTMIPNQNPHLLFFTRGQHKDIDALKEQLDGAISR